MRPLLPTLAACLVAFVPGLALGHGAHGPCQDTHSTVPLGLVHVDTGEGGCVGAIATLPASSCGALLHEHAGPVHLLALHGQGCQTGVLVEPLPPREGREP